MFIIYAIFNVYAIPIVITYMHKRGQNEHQILNDKHDDEPKVSKLRRNHLNCLIL